MADEPTPLDQVHANNPDARRLLEDLLEVLEDEDYAEVNIMTKFAALQMALFTAYTAVLGHFTPPEHFDNNKAMLMRLHEKLTTSMEGFDQSILAGVHAGLTADDVSELVH